MIIWGAHWWDFVEAMGAASTGLAFVVAAITFMLQLHDRRQAPAREVTQWYTHVAFTRFPPQVELATPAARSQTVIAIISNAGREPIYDVVLGTITFPKWNTRGHVRRWGYVGFVPPGEQKSVTITIRERPTHGLVIDFTDSRRKRWRRYPDNKISRQHLWRRLMAPTDGDVLQSEWIRH